MKIQQYVEKEGGDVIELILDGFHLSKEGRSSAGRVGLIRIRGWEKFRISFIHRHRGESALG